MAVYVDQLFNTEGLNKAFPYKQACHLYADTLEELHALAADIGHKREWFQNRPDFPHYDLTETRRALALKYGAISTSREHMVNHVRRNRKALLAATTRKEKDARTRGN